MCNYRRIGRIAKWYKERGHYYATLAEETEDMAKKTEKSNMELAYEMYLSALLLYGQSRRHFTKCASLYHMRTVFLWKVLAILWLILFVTNLISLIIKLHLIC